MYTPDAFRLDDPAGLAEAIRANPFATLVGMTDSGLLATHLPLLFDPSAGPHGTLLGHVARANPHARAIDPAVPSLAIFHGPQGYITPSWYEAKRETGKVVPTWNYVAIHAYGTLETFDDADRLLDLVTRLTDRHEAGRAQPWAVSDAPADFVAGMVKAIVGVALRIDRIEGKAKLSQNRPAADRPRVRDGLRADGNAPLTDAMARANG